VFDTAIRIVINAVGLWVALQIVPQLSFDYGDEWWKLLAVALVFAVVNSYIKPLVKVLSFPVTILTLGLVGFVINAGMLLLTALVSDQFGLGFAIDAFPPDLTADAFIGALLASVIISVVSTALGLVNLGRRIIT
jgi:putative membrane protein